MRIHVLTTPSGAGASIVEQRNAAVPKFTRALRSVNGYALAHEKPEI